MSGPTLPDLLSGSAFALRTAADEVTGAELVADARRMVGGLAELAPGDGVLIDVVDARAALTVAIAAWWNGLRVGFTRRDSPLDVVAQAQALCASIVVVDGPAPRAVRTGVAVCPVRALIGAPATGQPVCRPDGPALDLLTSGTTGRPKGIVMSHAAMVANAAALATAMDLGRRDRLWTSLPATSPGALATVILAAAVRGATAVLSRAGGPAGAVAEVVAVQPTVVYAVPEVYAWLSRSPAAGGAPGVRWWLSSSSALTPERFDRMRAGWGALVRSFYCASELGTVTFNDSDDPDVVRGGVGRPLPGVRLTVADPSVPGGPGRLVVGGELVASGVRTEAGFRAFPAEGICTEDRGFLDAAGRLVLTGREEDRIHVGSEVVDPQLVEACLQTHPAVIGCIVVARPHALLGSVLEARVVRRAGVEATARELVLLCRRAGLRGGWVPRSIRWVGAVPTTSAGKPDRQVLG